MLKSIVGPLRGSLNLGSGRSSYTQSTEKECEAHQQNGPCLFPLMPWVHTDWYRPIGTPLCGLAVGSEGPANAEHGSYVAAWATLSQSYCTGSEGFAMATDLLLNQNEGAYF